jgi:hypothetical protein
VIDGGECDLVPAEDLLDALPQVLPEKVVDTKFLKCLVPGVREGVARCVGECLIRSLRKFAVCRP